MNHHDLLGAVECLVMNLNIKFMTLKDLREWLKVVPEEYDDCQLVFREVMALDDDLPEQLIAGDDPITAATIDVGEREACFYNAESYKLTLDQKNGN